MAKSVKNIVQRMNKRVLSTREASRLAQNERRKTQRRLARVLTEETGKKVSWKEAQETAKSLGTLSQEARALSKTIESLTAKRVEGTKQRKGYEVQIERVAESLKTYTRAKYGRENLSKKEKPQDLARRNKMFERQINQSTLSDGLSVLKSNETHAFYAATQWIWQGADVSDNRNAMIMKEFGLSDLKQVYDLIVNKELLPEDFGFDDEELFEEWLDEIRERVDIDELRAIYHEEINEENDDPEVRYDKFAIANVRLRTANMKRHG